MYDTSNPFDWKYYKTVDYPGGQWTITDASLSPDNKYLAYSSIRPEVCLAATDPNDKSEPTVLDFSHTRRGALHGGWNMGVGSLPRKETLSYLSPNVFSRFGPSASLETAERSSLVQLIIASLSTTLKPGNPSSDYKITRTT